MNSGKSSTRTEPFSLEDFHGVSVESLGIAEKDRKLYRIFVEENKDAIEALWLRFLDEEASRPKDDWTPVMWRRIKETPLSNHAKNALRCYEVTMVGHLVQLSPKDLLGFRNVGRCTMHEIMKYLESIGLELASD